MITGSDFRLYHSNDLSLLGGIMASLLQSDVDAEDILKPETILIPQPAMKRWLQMVLAQQHGIAANLRFLTPGEFVREALHANQLESVASVFSAETLRWRLFSVLLDKTQWQHAALRSIAPYLRGKQSEMKAWTLANECANAFEKYQAWRRDWCLEWDRGAAPLDWQAHLWRQVTQGKTHRGQAIEQYLQRFEPDHGVPAQGLPKRLFVFACLNVSPDVLRVIATAARTGPLHFFLPSPSRKYWGDISSLRERLQRTPDAVFAQEEHPLLQSWGRAGRDFIATLFSNNTVALRGDADVYVANKENTLLARVKNDVLERQAPTVIHGNIDKKDLSLQVHVCHTPLREVQVLHDQLHRLFLNDPNLQARDIAIMAPDIDTYAGFIDAVFGAAKNTSRFIPYRLSDRQLPQHSPLLATFLRLLALPTLTFTSNEVMDLLGDSALADPLEFDEDCRRWWPFWITQAGARWGLHAQHRQQHGVPADHLSTWAFALDRLLLGHASGDRTLIHQVAPVIELEGQALNTLDKLIRGLRLLARFNEVFRHAHKADVWALRCSELLHLLDKEKLATSQEAAALSFCQSAIAQLQEQCEQAQLHDEIAPDIIRDYFSRALAEQDASQNFLSGGVTVCRMVPMRQIPFKVICLLGLNEGAMPRSEPPSFIQRLSEEIKSSRTRRFGDRSLRDDDRFLFLQLLCAAENTFYLSYCGRHPRDDAELAPSSLVSELLDCLASMYPEQADFHQTFVLQHPLQVFSGVEDPDERRLRFDAAWQAEKPESATHDIRFLTADRHKASVVTDTFLQWQDIQRFFKHPARYFLQQRLAMHIHGPEEKLDEHEPFSGSGLQRYQLRHAIFNALLVNEHMPDNAELLAYCRSLALLPAGFSAEARLYKTLTEVKAQALRFKHWQQAEASTLPFEIKVGAHTLQGTLAQMYPNGVARIVLGEMQARHHCSHGLDALLLSALGSDKAVVEFAEIKKSRPLQRVRSSHASDTAMKHLEAMVHLFLRGQQEALPFDADASFAYVNYLTATPSSNSQKLRELAMEKTIAAHAQQDIWWRTAFRGQDVLSDTDTSEATSALALEFHDIALQVVSACAPELLQPLGQDDE